MIPHEKRLIHGLLNDGIDGEVIRYDSDGKEQYNALFKNGRLASGTIQLIPLCKDKNVAYMEVTKNSDKLKVKFIHFEDNIVLNAEETLVNSSAVLYLDKLDIDLDCLTASRLY